MPILEFVIPCQLSSIDQRNGSSSLYYIVENIEIIRRPWDSDAVFEALASVPMEVVTSWRLLPDETNTQQFVQILSFTSPDEHEEEISRSSFAIPLLRHRLHIQFIMTPRIRTMV